MLPSQDGAGCIFIVVISSPTGRKHNYPRQRLPPPLPPLVCLLDALRGRGPDQPLPVCRLDPQALCRKMAHGKGWVILISRGARVALSESGFSLARLYLYPLFIYFILAFHFLADFQFYDSVDSVYSIYYILYTIETMIGH